MNSHTPTFGPARFDELPHGEVLLSPAGLRRREAMLEALEGEVRARGRRRVVSRAAAGAGGLAALVALVMTAWTWMQPHVASPAAPIAVAPTLAPDAPAPQVPAPEVPTPRVLVAAPVRSSRLVAYVVDDPDVVERAAPEHGGPSVELLDDEALLRELRAAGLPAGLVRTPGRTRLAYHNAGASEARP